MLLPWHRGWTGPWSFLLRLEDGLALFQNHNGSKSLVSGSKLWAGVTFVASVERPRQRTGAQDGNSGQGK